MVWVHVIASVAILVQILFIIQVGHNFNYVIKKSRTVRRTRRPKTAIIVPCKGLDTTFKKNISSFYELDYKPYLLIFVVEDKSDAAYEPLCRIRDELLAGSQAQEARILVAGVTKGCGQKLHNMLYAYENIADEVEVLAFADSDACVCSKWLAHLTHPLRKPKKGEQKIGASSGYRLFIPQKNNPATLTLSSINAKVAQLLGDTRFNQAWGGSMAIRVDIFRQLELDKIWSTAISDDLTLSRAVKKAGLRIAFAPACLVASYEETTWGKLFEFARRQFLITRITMPGTWWFGLFSSLFAVLGFWGGAAAAIYGFVSGVGSWQIFAAMSVTFFIGQLWRSILRQKMIRELLADDAEKMRVAARADLFGCSLWSLITLALIISSAFGRTIKWRGRRYKLLSATKTQIIE